MELNLIISLIAILAFAVADAMSDAWIFRDFQSRKLREIADIRQLFDSAVSILNSNRNWHAWQAVRQTIFLVLIGIYASRWIVPLIAAAVFWLLHNGIVNIVGLDKPFFFVGTTAMIDKFFQRFKNPSLMMGIAKFALLIGSIMLYIFI